MDNSIKAYAGVALKEIEHHLKEEIIPYWLNKAVDYEYGGYLTCFDQSGKPWELTDKYIVTQTRMIWGLSLFKQMYPENTKIDEALKTGVDFFINKFWDAKNGGWFWKVKRDGTVIDDGKVLYGQSFAIYALSQYTLSTGDYIGQYYAEKTFDLMQKYCADNNYGGYYENLENDWTISEKGFAAGDRKSLDIHMHIMEALTVLYQVTGKEIHARKLKEVIEIILSKMIDKDNFCGCNQFDIEFNRIPAINIRRTWNAERPTGETIAEPVDSTSYGHNVELAWLLNRATDVLGKDKHFYNGEMKKLVDHALSFGLDYDFGGVYRDGPHDGEPLVKDKEWWQNCEVLVGFLDAYTRIGDVRYFDAFKITWEFDKKYMIDEKQREWKQLVTFDGKTICGDMGNPWKAIYHTGRSMYECIIRLREILGN